MPNCPLCQTSLKDDFGLVDCPGCQAPLFIDMDGSVVSAAGASPTSAPSPEIGVAQDLDSAQELENFSLPAEEQSADQDEFLPDYGGFEEVHDTQDPPELQGDFRGVEMDPLNGVHTDVQQPPEVAEPLEPVAPPEPFAVAPPAAEADSLEDLTEFANSEASQGKEGLLRFHLTIEGIDSSDLRRDVAEALQDKKFMWDDEELLRSIRQGRLVLQDISAVKVVILIRRLREKPLKITWEQHAIHRA